MQTPYFHFSIARRHLEVAVELSPDKWKAWAALGTLSLLDGNRDVALEELTLAVSAKGAPLDTLDALYLGYASQQAGVSFPFGR